MNHTQQSSERKSHSVKALVRVFGLILAVALFASPSKADGTYTYTGQPYDPSSCDGTYAPICSQTGVTGSFTLANPLAPNLPLTGISPLQFSFTDGGGVFSITSATTLADFIFAVGTDTLGNIDSWAIEFSTTPPINGKICGDQTGSFECLGTNNSNGDFSAYGFNLGTPSQSFGGGFNHVPGSWVLATAPEPSSLLLLAAGVLLLSILLGFARRVSI